MRAEHSEQNIQKDQKVRSEWFDLSEASKITGLTPDALRKRIKAGKIKGQKVRTKKGFKWQIYSHDIDDIGIVDNTGLKSDIQNQKEQKTKSELIMAELVKTKDELISEKDRRLSDLENVLTIFQERIQILESDKAILENKLKLLPAPPEFIKNKLCDLEEELLMEKSSCQTLSDEHERLRGEMLNQEDIRRKTEGLNLVLRGEIETAARRLEEAERALQEEKKVRAELEESLKTEKKRAWWRKLLRIK